MKNNYESPEVAEIGKAQDVILGSKVATTPYDSASDRNFQPPMDDDE